MNQQDYINQYALPYLQMTSQGDDEQSLRNKELLSNYLDNPAQYADSLMIEAAKSDIINPKKFNVEGFTSNHSIGISPSNDFNFSYRPPTSEVDGSQQGLFNSYKDNLNDNKPAISEKEKDFNLNLSEDQQHANEIIKEYNEGIGYKYGDSRDYGQKFLSSPAFGLAFFTGDNTDAESWDWVKSGYSGSLSYQIESYLYDDVAPEGYKVKKRLAFDPDLYDPSLMEEIGSSIIAMTYPVDAIMLKYAPKGLKRTRIGGNHSWWSGYKQSLMNGKKYKNLYKNKDMREKVVDAHLATIQSTAIGGGTFGAYEGAKGFLMEYNDSRDIWKASYQGLKDFAYGVALGSTTAGITTKMSTYNAINRMKIDAKPALAQTLKWQQRLTGKMGQFGAETANFTAFDMGTMIHQQGWDALTWDNFLHAMFRSAGTIGGLKAMGASFERGSKYLRDGKQTYLKNKLEENLKHEKSDKAIDNVIENLKDDSSSSGTKNSEIIKKTLKENKDKIKNDLKAEKELKDYDDIIREADVLSKQAKELESKGTGDFKSQIDFMQRSIDTMFKLRDAAANLINVYKKQNKLKGVDKRRATDVGKTEFERPLTERIKNLEDLVQRLDNTRESMNSNKAIIGLNLKENLSRKDVLKELKKEVGNDTVNKRIEELKVNNKSESEIDAQLNADLVVIKDSKSNTKKKDSSLLKEYENKGEKTLAEHNSTKKIEAKKKKKNKLFEALEVVNNQVKGSIKSSKNFIADLVRRMEIQGSTKDKISQSTRTIIDFAKHLKTETGKNLSDLGGKRGGERVSIEDLHNAIRSYLEKKIGTSKKAEVSTKELKAEWNRVLDDISRALRTNKEHFGGVSVFEIGLAQGFGRFQAPSQKTGDVHITTGKGKKQKISTDPEGTLDNIVRNKLKDIKDVVVKVGKAQVRKTVTFTKEKMKALYHVAFATAARPGEIANFRVKDIDFATGKIQVFEGKLGGALRYSQTLSNKSLKIIKDHINKHNLKANDPLFVSEKTLNETRQIQKKIDALGKKDIKRTALEKQILSKIKKELPLIGKAFNISLEKLGHKLKDTHKTKKNPLAIFRKHTDVANTGTTKSGKGEHSQTKKLYAQGQGREFKTKSRTSTELETPAMKKKILDWVDKVHERLKIKEVDKITGDKRGDKEGSILGHEIEVIRGEKSKDTVPHEVAHNVIDVLTRAGTTVTRKIINRGKRLILNEHKRTLKDPKKARELEARIRREGGLEKVTYEDLVDMVGKRATDIILSSPVGKVKAWFNQAYAKVKNILGIASKKDIANILGWEVFRGEKGQLKEALVDYSNFEMRGVGEGAGWKMIEGRRQFKTSPEGTQRINMRKKIRAQLKLMGIIKSDVNPFLKEIGRDLNILDSKGQFNLSKVKNITHLEHITSVVEKIVDSYNNAGKKGPIAKHKKIARLLDLEVQYNITKSQSKDIIKSNWNKDSLYDLSMTQLNLYMSSIKQFGTPYQAGKRKPTLNETITELLDSGKLDQTVVGRAKKAASQKGAPVFFFLDNFGGKAGKVIARKLLDQSYYEALAYGIADKSIPVFDGLLKSGGVGKERIQRLNTIWMIEPKEVASFRKNGGKFSKAEQTVYDALYYKSGKPRFSFNKNGEMLFKTRGLKKQQLDILDAFAKYHEMTDVYFNEMIKVAEKNQSKAEHQDFLTRFSKKYIDGYFTRSLSKEGRHFLFNTSKGQKYVKHHFTKHIERVAEEIAREHAGGNKKKFTQILRDLRMIEIDPKTGEIIAPLTKKNVQNGLTPKGAEIIKDIVEQSFKRFSDANKFGPQGVFDGFLMERMPRFESIMIGDTKLRSNVSIQMYDHTFANTVGNYVTGVSKYVSTGMTFPEFTIMKGSQHKTISRAQIEALNRDIGHIALTTMQYQLGMDKGLFDVKSNPLMNKVTGGAAQVGLLSPKAGFKNLLLGMATNMSVHGIGRTFKGYAHAIASEPLIQGKAPKWFKNLTKESVRQREKAQEGGALEFGHRAYETETRILDFVFRNVNLMSKTESWNRMVSTFAAEIGLMDKAMILQGKHGGTAWLDKKIVNRVKDELKMNYYLDKAQIKFLEKMDLSKASHQKIYKDILARARHFSHIGTQGATNPIFLPKWMSHPGAKGLTLFYRIATSVTNGLVRNVGVPLVRHQNPAPLLRYIVGTYFGSEIMYQLESWMYGRDMHPASTEEQGSYNRIMANLVKGEFFGIFTQVAEPLSPQKRFNQKGIFEAGPFMQPVLFNMLNNILRDGGQIIRNFKNVGEGKLTAGEVLLQGLNDILSGTVPIWQQGKNIYKYNYTNPRAAKKQDLFNYINQYEKFDTARLEYNKDFTEGNVSFWAYDAPLQKKNLLDALMTEGLTSKEFEEQFVINFAIEFEKLTRNNETAIEAKKKVFQKLRQSIHKSNPFNIFTERLKAGGKADRDRFRDWVKKQEEKLGLDKDHIWNKFIEYEDWWEKNSGDMIKEYYWNNKKIDAIAATGNDAGTQGYNEIPGHKKKHKKPKHMNDAETEDWFQAISVPVIGPIPTLDDSHINGQGHDYWDLDDDSNPWLTP